jgi:1,4-alpha-glucan branching enzyme
MKKSEFGIWEITVPPLPSGLCAIPHDTKIKVCKNLVMITQIKQVSDLNDTPKWQPH